MFGIFAIFPAIRLKLSSQKFITANIFPAKIYFRVNIPKLKLATQKCSTLKQLYPLNYNLSLSFRNKVINKNDPWAKLSLVFAGLRPLWYCLCIFFARTQSKNDNIINNLSGTFWKTQKLTPSKKSQSVLIAKISSAKIQKKIANPQMKINARKSFVAHDIGQNQFEIILT